jgi:hypothetical protein
MLDAVLGLGELAVLGFRHGLCRPELLGHQDVVGDVPADPGNLRLAVGAGMGRADVAYMAHIAVRHDDAILRTVFEVFVQRLEQGERGWGDVVGVNSPPPIGVAWCAIAGRQAVQMVHSLVPGTLLRVEVDLPNADLGGFERQIEPMRYGQKFPFAGSQRRNVALAFVDEAAGQQNRDDDDRGGDENGDV